MDEGEALIQINQGSDNFEIDYIEINNNDNIYENDFEIQTEPVAPEASDETKLRKKLHVQTFHPRRR